MTLGCFGCTTLHYYQEMKVMGQKVVTLAGVAVQPSDFPLENFPLACSAC